MRRRRYRKLAVKMSLFPFLAVLICTMGALIVLLVTVVQQARVHASLVSEQRQQSQEEDPEQLELRLQRDDFLWRRDIFEQQCATFTERATDRRLQLSHLEGHIRRLEREWKQLKQEAAQLEAITNDKTVDLAQAQAGLEQLRTLRERRRKELDEAKREAESRRRTFAIVPYKGPHGTDRRPIFIECTEKGILLQPEGVVLTEADFAGPLGPGNPLDAALRATREYLVRSGATERDGEPYPLLIVRPGGIVAYNVARAAMRSWDEEFGYELVESDVELAFPPSDPRLREALQHTVADARQRQALLAAAMPSQYRGELPAGVVATPTRGGFVRAGASPSQMMTRNGAGRGNAVGTADNAEGAPRELRVWNRTHETESSGEALHQEGTSAPDSAENPLADSPGGTPPPPHSPQAAAMGADGGQCTPVANVRGKDWGLPKANVHATGITRPIRVACLPDQFVVFSEQGEGRPPRVIGIADAMTDSIDDFVNALWVHMEDWGIAVASGYWKPILHVEVAPGAESRFRELQVLLENSGIEVTRKRP